MHVTPFRFFMITIINQHHNIKSVFSSVLSLFSDRTCTVLNVEGDAFGAGLLQFFVDKTSKHEGVAELSEVRLDGDLAAGTPEYSPLIDKRGLEGAKADLSAEKESAM